MSILAQLEITGVVSTDLFCLRGITILVKNHCIHPFQEENPMLNPHEATSWDMLLRTVYVFLVLCSK